MSFKSIIFLFFVSALLTACGEGTVDTADFSYNPKIVIQGTLIPGQIAQVRLRRNVPLNVIADPNDMILRNANAEIIDEDGNSFLMRHNTVNQMYEAGQLRVDYGKTYTLQVQAVIDGKDLSATSTTTVPQQGFEVLEEKSRLGSMVYRSRDALGGLINFSIVVERSPGTDFYPASVTSLNADTSSFIYDNPFADLDSDDVLDDLIDFKYNYTWIQDAPLTAGESFIDIFSFFTWFYGDYQVVVYAGDRNFKDFLLTFEQIQEIDGNFHEPALHIDGDGIGYFASAIADTAYFTVLRE